MKTFLNEFKFVLLLLGVITVITGLTNVDYDSEPQAMARVELHSKIENNLAEVVVPARVPASVQETKMPTLEKDFFCNHSLDDSRSERIPKSMVMLNFKLCKENKLIDKISIKNETNGFRAQVFKTDNFKFKTDYIQLNSGSNRIMVEVILKDGQKNVDSLEILSGS